MVFHFLGHSPHFAGTIIMVLLIMVMCYLWIRPTLHARHVVEGFMRYALMGCSLMAVLTTATLAQNVQL